VLTYYLTFKSHTEYFAGLDLFFPKSNHKSIGKEGKAIDVNGLMEK
jgi:hypothetical protein